MLTLQSKNTWYHILALLLLVILTPPVGYITALFILNMIINSSQDRWTNIGAMLTIGLPVILIPLISSILLFRRFEGILRWVTLVITALLIFVLLLFLFLAFS